jgi:hypothetical protein
MEAGRPGGQAIRGRLKRQEKKNEFENKERRWQWEE